MSLDTPETTQSKKGNRILDIIKNLFANVTKGLDNKEETTNSSITVSAPTTDTFDRELTINIDNPDNEATESYANIKTETKDVDTTDDVNKDTLNKLETPLDIRDEEKDLDVSNLSINEDEYMDNDPTMKNKVKNIIIIIIVIVVSICALVLIFSWITALTKSISSTGTSTTISSVSTTGTTTSTSGNVIDENVKVTNGGFDLFSGFIGGSNNQTAKSVTTSKKAYVDKLAGDFSLTGFETSLVDWNITSQRPTVKSDLTQEQYDQGWINGYMIKVSGTFSTDYKNFGYTDGEITQIVDRYPESSMGKVLELGYKIKDSKVTNCTVSDTKQDLKLDLAHKIYLVECGDHYGDYYNEKYLVAQFYKKGVFETIEFRSSQLDLAFFRRVLVDSIAKID